MSEFSTSAELEVRVSDSSLRAAKQQIEDELGATNVNATASNQLRSDGGVSSGRGGITELLTEQQQTNAHFEDNLGLNETRNDLLRELVENTEGGSGGGDGLNLRNLLRGGLAGLLGLGGVALGLSQVNWGRLISDSLPDLDPGDIIDPVQVGVGDIIAAGATVSASALILSRLTVEAGHLIAERASIAVSDLISNPVEVGATALLGALIANSVTLTAQQILDHLVEGGSGSSDPSTDPTTDPSTDPSSDPSGNGSGFFDDVTDIVTDPAVAAPAAITGAGAAVANSGIVSAILSSGASSGFGAATAGSMSVAGLGPAAAALATFGIPIATATMTGKYGENATVNDYLTGNTETLPTGTDTPGIEPDVTSPFMPVNFDEGSSNLNPYADYDVGNVYGTDMSDAEWQEMMQQVDAIESSTQSGGGNNSSTTVDATIETVDVSVEDATREQITQRTVEEIRRELMRQLPDDISNIQQRRFDSLFP